MAFARRNIELLPQAADVQAMRQFRRSSVISGSKNAAVTDQSGAHRPPPSCAAPGNKLDYIQKISIPVGTIITSRRCILRSCFEFRHIFRSFSVRFFSRKLSYSLLRFNIIDLSITAPSFLKRGRGRFYKVE